jgi:hypothetical protein
MEQAMLKLLPSQEQHFDEEDLESSYTLEEDSRKNKLAFITEVQESSRSPAALIVFVVFVVLVTATAGVLYTMSRMHEASKSSLHAWGHCGNTTAEARANGCILDFIPGAWVRPACYDAELEAEFLQLQDWKWYADNETQHELSLQYIRQTGGSNPLFVSKEYHKQHCAYTWMKLHRSIIRGVPIDSHIGAYKHTVHCGRALAAAELPVVSKFYEIFTHCEMPEKCMYILP